jgi:aminomethyltransferase
LKKTALYDAHLAHGGRMVDFGGWSLPVQYVSVIQEHEAVRNACGVFDTSHMGQILVRGKAAFPFIQKLLSNNLERIGDGRSLYSGLLTEAGCFVDDLIVSQVSREEYLLVVNASNIEKDETWIRKHAAGFEVTVENASGKLAMLAIQGKTAPAVLEKLFPGEYGKLGSFSFSACQWKGAPAFFCRTGYTGEAGVEVILANESATGLFEAVLAAGAVPCGLGSRDSLRLEKGYSLYGHEIDETTNALEAGLGWTVDFSKPDFIGKSALSKIKAEGPARRLVGLVMEERGVPRNGYAVHAMGGETIGHVTSGTFGPSLKESIALAYVPRGYGEAKVKVAIRDKLLVARVTKRDFSS